jgi:hypothetical protein
MSGGEGGLSTLSRGRMPGRFARWDGGKSQGFLTDRRAFLRPHRLIGGQGPWGLSMRRDSHLLPTELACPGEVASAMTPSTGGGGHGRKRRELRECGLGH